MSLPGLGTLSVRDSMSNKRLSAVLAAGQARQRPVPTGTPTGAEGVAGRVTVADLEVDMFAQPTTDPSFNGRISNKRAYDKMLVTFDIKNVQLGTPAETFAAYSPDRVNVQWSVATAAEREAVKEYVHNYQKREVTNMLAVAHKRFPSLIMDAAFFNTMTLMLADDSFFEVTMEIYKRVPASVPWVLEGERGVIGQWVNGELQYRLPSIRDVHGMNCGYTLMMEALRRSLASRPIVSL